MPNCFNSNRNENIFLKICLYFNACLFLYPDFFLKRNNVFYSNKWYRETKVNNIVRYNFDLVKMKAHIGNSVLSQSLAL